MSRVVGTAVGGAAPPAVAVDRMLETTLLGRMESGTEAAGLRVSEEAPAKMLETCDGCKALVGTADGATAVAGALERRLEIKLVGTADSGTDWVGAAAPPPRIDDKRLGGMTLLNNH